MSEYAEPQVFEAELVPLVDAMPKPLEYPPVIGPTYAELVEAACVCGNTTPRGHGYNPRTGHRALTCAEVLEIRDRVNADLARPISRLRRLLGGAR